MLPVNVNSCDLFSIFLLKLNLISYGASQHSSNNRVSCCSEFTAPAISLESQWTLDFSYCNVHAVAGLQFFTVFFLVYRREQKGKKEARKDKDKKTDSEEQDKSREEENDDDDERMEEEEQNEEEEVDN